MREFKALGQEEQQTMKSKLVQGEVKRLEVFPEKERAWGEGPKVVKEMLLGRHLAGEGVF